MALRMIESHFERMSVNDENEPTYVGKLYPKPKVGTFCRRDGTMLNRYRGRSPLQCPSLVSAQRHS